MGGINTKRALILSGSVILLCMSIIVGMTAALFTDTEKVTNHLKAGTMDVTLTRTKLTYTYLNHEGFMATNTDTQVKDFTDSSHDNIFALDGALIVPQTKYIAEMQVANNTETAPSDAAFGYWIEVVYTGANDVHLSEQVEITVTTSDGATTALAKQGITLGSESAPLGVVAVGGAENFTVTLEFLDLENSRNNLAQGETISLDLIVHAFQYT